MVTRYLEPFIRSDLKKKMVFLGGPRQVVKTTLAQSLIKNYTDGHPAYLNWDSEFDKKKIKTCQWPGTGDGAVSPHIFYFRDRTDIPHFYQVHLGKAHRQVDDQVSLLPFTDFCKQLNLP